MEAVRNSATLSCAQLREWARRIGHAHRLPDLVNLALLSQAYRSTVLRARPPRPNADGLGTPSFGTARYSLTG
jgi:hypothetical protein